MHEEGREEKKATVKKIEQKVIQEEHQAAKIARQAGVRRVDRPRRG